MNTGDLGGDFQVFLRTGVAVVYQSGRVSVSDRTDTNDTREGGAMSVTLQSRYTWDDVSRYCFAGSSVDVPHHFTSKGYGSYVVWAFEDGGETWLKLANGEEIPADTYMAPLGWEPPK